MSGFSEVCLYTDGASRGNPGLAAIAFRITSVEGQELDRHAEVIGNATNNEAEYRALIAGLTSVPRFTRGRVRCVSDSQLIIRQLIGRYGVREPTLLALFLNVRRLERQFERVSFEHRSRTDPQIAQVDRLANQALDRYRPSAS